MLTGEGLTPTQPPPLTYALDTHALTLLMSRLVNLLVHGTCLD